MDQIIQKPEVSNKSIKTLKYLWDILFYLIASLIISIWLLYIFMPETTINIFKSPTNALLELKSCDSIKTESECKMKKSCKIIYQDGPDTTNQWGKKGILSSPEGAQFVNCTHY